MAKAPYVYERSSLPMRRFTSLASETPDPERRRVDGDVYEVRDADKLPAAAKGRDRIAFVDEMTGSDVIEADVFWASTREERRLGLSRKGSLDEHEGMIFEWGDFGKHALTMRNMSFPVDMVFVDDLGTVTKVVENVQPGDDEAYVGASKYAIELPAGFCEKHGIKRAWSVFRVENPSFGFGGAVGKDRRYIDHPSEAPQGAEVHVGEREGLYYEEESVEAFEDYVEDHREQVFEEYEFTDEQVREAEEEYEFYAERAEDIFEDVWESAPSENIAEAGYRVKTPASMLEKVHYRDTDHEEIDDLTDVMGTQIYVEDAAQLSDTADQVVSEMEERGYEVAEEKDYVDDPKGIYRATHYIFQDEDGRDIELQIKPESLEEVYSVSHETIYKNVAGFEDDVLDDIEECLDQIVRREFGEQVDPDCTATAAEAIQSVAQ